MSLRWIMAGAVVVAAVLVYFAWTGSRAPAERSSAMIQGDAAARPMPDVGHSAETGDPSIKWNAPTTWSAEPGRGMRLATYAIPGSAGAAPAECAVFYFGPGQGGTAQANIERWIGEFQDPTAPERSTRQVRGFTVTRLWVQGTYSAHAGSATEPPASRSDHALLGAVVEGPSGSVFFKLTGPVTTVRAAAPDFDRMLGSVKAR